MSGAEERYTQVFSAISEAVFTLDLDGIIKEVNEALTTFTGYRKEELVNKKFTDIVAPEYMGLVQLILKKTLDGKTISKGEMQLIKADKTKLWCQISTAALRDDAQTILGQVCILRDTTAQKSKEDELKSSEKFLSNVVDNGIDAVYSYDNKGKITYFSKGGEKLLGWRAEEVVSQNFELLIAPEALSKLKGQLTSRRADEHRTYQTVLVSKGGRRIDVVQKVIPIYKDTEVVETCGIVTNITSQQKLQAEMVALNEKLNGLIRLGKMISSRINLEEILNFIVGSITTFAKVDIAVLRLLNDDKTELVLRTCFGVDKGQVPEKIVVAGAMTRKALEEERVISIGDISEEQVLTPVETQLGEPVTSMLAVPLIARREGKGILYLYTRDYCQFSRQQIDLAFAFVNQAAIAVESAVLYGREQETVAKLRDLDQAKSDFLSMVSHELRTPLTSIKGYTALILGGKVGDINEKQRKFLEIVADQSNHLTKLISDLLDLSRIESGKFILRKQRISLKIVTELITERMRLQIDTKNLKLTTDIADNLPSIEGDEERMMQVFGNLMSNSVKFTPEGGNVTVKMWAENNNIEVRFIDNGIGLSQDSIAKIFSEFYQVDSTATRQIGGAGLGLAIVKKIIEAHGGKVWAESEGIGKGTTVCVSVPAAAPTPSASETPAQSTQSQPEGQLSLGTAGTKQRTILIVDDDQAVIDLLKQDFAKAGYKTIEALSGYKAVELARQYKPDIITLALKLPDIDGSQVIGLLRKEDSTQNIPIMILSVVKDKQEGFLRSGVVEYLSKPIDKDKLLSTAEKILAAKGVTSGGRILVADDEPLIVSLIKNILSEKKYTIIEAFDGYQAMDLAEKENPDMIFLDIVMPGMDGYEVVQKLKENVKTQDIPAVIISVRKIEEDKAKGIILGGVKYLTRPFKGEELIKEIDGVLEGQR
jgi:PAS domain S-box-containing protein